jgi:phage N-6-adenine-methyltransferase
LYQTPKSIFNYYNHRFNFTTDVASSFKNRLCRDHRSEKFDGLLTGWGDVNWCNPPYSNITPWVMKAIEQQVFFGRVTVMLIPADTSSKWFKLAFDHCSECHLITGRISFIRSDTQKPALGNNKGSVVFVFGQRDSDECRTLLVDRDILTTVSQHDTLSMSTEENLSGKK